MNPSSLMYATVQIEEAVKDATGNSNFLGAMAQQVQRFSDDMRQVSHACTTAPLRFPVGHCPAVLPFRSFWRLPQPQKIN